MGIFMPGYPATTHVVNNPGFCERQCALIHIERLWAENQLTVEGVHMHRRAHEAPAEMRDGVRITRALPLRSMRLGLVGKADVVEFHPATEPQEGRRVPDDPTAPAWIPVPVEYKRGRPKRDDSDRVQLCAQALCLEEMLGVTVLRGAIFYGQTRRRLEVVFDESLRSITEEAALRLHRLIASERTPPARREPKCDRCSLLHLCLPDALAPQRSASHYFDRELDRIIEALGDED